MSYTALYRKFRPQSFDEVKGQDAIVTTLKNQLNADRIGHAYLFCGTRGTGKTTIAKIFAKAVNCKDPKDGSPCGECSSCRAVSAGVSVNVIEIDAASNNGVDSIREIREEVTYRPTEGRYKVYIIDEVHMLSAGAFNALLKTLEEPPSYVIFILATTEAHKIPVTILSRCQRYDFRRISVDTICSRLEELLEQEQIEAEEKAVRYIAKSADGAMRDALSLLDQCIAFYLGQKLTYEKVLEVLGAVDTEVFGSLFCQISAQNIVGTIDAVEKLSSEGRELGQFAIDFTWYLRNMLLLKSSDETIEALDMSEETMRRIRKEGERASEETLMRYIRILSELSNQMRYSAQKRTLLEIALIKLCRPQMEQDYSSLIGRIEQIEKKLEKGIPASFLEKEQRVEEAENQNEPPKKVFPEAVPEDVKKAVKNWRSIISSMPGAFRSYLSKAKLTLGSGSELVLVFEDTMAAAYCAKEKEISQLEGAIAEQTGRQVSVVVRENAGERSFRDAQIDLEQVIHMEIIYDEEE